MKTKAGTPEISSGGTAFRSRGSNPFGVQPKLFVNNPGDRHEAEADHAADRIVRGNTQRSTAVASAPPPVQMKEEETVQQKPIAETVTPYIQRKESSDQMGELDIPGTEDGIGQVGHEGQKIQRKEDDESAQMKEEDDSVQAKEEDESAQMKEEDDSAQAKEEDEGIQKKEEEDSAQLKEDDDVQAKEEEDSAQMKEEDEEVQTKRFRPSPAPVSDISSTLKSSKGQGSPLSDGVKSKMESGFGADFSNVRVHTGAKAVGMSKELGAKAFTNKGDIYFNEGKFNPASKDGEFLLAHELTHTLQQGAASAKTEDEKGTAVQTAEKEADKAVQNNPSISPATAAAPASPEAKVGVDKTIVQKPAEGVIPGEPVPAGETTAPAEKASVNPKDDPNFAEVIANIGVTAEEQSEHDPAKKVADNAQEAAPVAANERQGDAEADQVEEMEKTEPKEFSATEFKQKLMEKIEEMKLPADEEEADDFEKHNNIDEVTQSSVGEVKTAKSEAAGPVEKVSNEQPNVSAVQARKVAPLKSPKKGPAPKSVGASKAIPPKKGEEAVSAPLKEQTGTIDAKMAESNVTDEQLAKSNEPKFEQALDSKKEANKNAAEAPAGFRQKEDATLQGASAASEAKSQEELTGMHELRKSGINKVMGDQKATGQKDTSERQKVADEINGIYEQTKYDVDYILDSLEEKVTKRFEYTAKIAKKAFEDYVEGSMVLYKIERYGKATGIISWGRDLFMGLPEEVNQFFVEGKQVFINRMDEGITNIANLVAKELNNAKKRIAWGRVLVTKHVNGLPKHLKRYGKEAAAEVQEKFTGLEDDVASREESLIDTLAQEYMSAMDEVDERIEEMKEANKGLVDAAMGFINGVIDTINKLVEMITNLFAAIKSVIGVIIADPLGFMGNLFDGIGKGIDAFKANIQNHLLGGLLEWLTGSLGPMGIVMPKDLFSLSGIFSLVMQVMGLGWEFIRQKAVMMMGEPVVKTLESSYDMFKTFATKGIDGIWEFLKDKFSDLKETVMDAIKDMLITQVIQAGIKWLLSLLIPGAGFIKAIMAIKDLIVFFVESAMMLIPAITEAILALAAGSVAGVAIAIEKGLAKLISLVIGLFAKLIGLGGLSKKVTKIFKKIRKRVDKAVMKLLNKAKKAGKRLFGSIKGKGGKKATQKDLEENKKAGKEEVSVPFNLAGTSHKLLYVPKGKDGGFSLEMRSKQSSLQQREQNLIASLDKYIHSDIPEDIKDHFRVLKKELGSGLTNIENTVKQKLSKGKNKKINKDKIRNDEIEKVLNIAVHGITTLVNNPKLKLQDLTPLALEEADMRAKLGPIFSEKQQKVEAVYHSFQEELKVLLPKGSIVKYRGSLARGIKGPHKLTAEGAIRFFDPNNFDVDVFIEVTPQSWKEIQSQVAGARGKQRIAFKDMGTWNNFSDIEIVMHKIQSVITKETGADNSEKVNLVFQTSVATEKQEREGVDYPIGSFEKAGYPEHERKLNKVDKEIGKEKVIEKRLISPEENKVLIS